LDSHLFSPLFSSVAEAARALVDSGGDDDRVTDFVAAEMDSMFIERVFEPSGVVSAKEDVDDRFLPLDHVADA
jgi:hypothetical protein